jgi:ABC-type Na+ efflux pump permease subunit
MKKWAKILPVVAFAFLLSASICSAQVPSATSTLDTLMEVIIGTTVSLATTVFTTYWPYLLVFGVLAGIVGLMYRFVRLGTGKHGK